MAGLMPAMAFFNRHTSRAMPQHHRRYFPTTHVGSLPRSQPVVDQIFARERGEAVDEALFNET
ncbi:MAG: hypothetical protein ACKOB5_13245, partial [Betaproteobacteria bacterium]